MPICESDKKILKHNSRKLQIYEIAYNFCEDLFSLQNAPQMTKEQLLEFTSGILSILLSHHYQKEDIKKIVEGTMVDFQLVRDAMYKYSKKAEEKLFQNACMAYFFIQFGTVEKGKTYMLNKTQRGGEQENGQ